MDIKRVFKMLERASSYLVLPDPRWKIVSETHMSVYNRKNYSEIAECQNILKRTSMLANCFVSKMSTVRLWFEKVSVKSPPLPLNSEVGIFWSYAFFGSIKLFFIHCKT